MEKSENKNKNDEIDLVNRNAEQSAEMQVVCEAAATAE